MKILENPVQSSHNSDEKSSRQPQWLWGQMGGGDAQGDSRRFASEESLLLVARLPGPGRSGALTHPVKRAVLQAVDSELSALCKSCLQGD